MPKIDIALVAARQGSGYPPPFDAPCAARTLALIEDGGETVLRAGDSATFPKGTGNGHHMINRSSVMAVYLEVGARNPNDVTTCSDIDLMSTNADGSVSTEAIARPLHRIVTPALHAV